MDGRTGFRRNSKDNILRALWRAMIAHVLEGHSTSKKGKNLKGPTFLVRKLFE